MERTDTLTPVEELEGRALDAAVAEEVFGCAVRWLDRWETIDDELVDGPVPECGCGDHRHDVAIERRDDDEDWTEYSLRHYSTDIAAAWEVAERVQLFGTGWDDYAGQCLRRAWNGNDAPWEVGRFEDRTGWGDCEKVWSFVQLAVGETAPRAICRAALKAVRETRR